MIPALMLAAVAPTAPIQLDVDARRIPQGIVQVTETFPVKPGKRGFYFPKFIPGEHRASGPINGLVGLHFYADGKEVPWRRDSVELFKFWVDVPAGVTSLQAKFTNVSDEKDVATPNLARVKWNRILLYPEGKTTDTMPIVARITPPTDWTIASALAKGPVSVTELIDSPAILGRYFRSYEVGQIQGAPIYLDVLAEEKGYEVVPPAQLDRVRTLIVQASKLFGGRHFRQYRFLVTLSDHGAGAGLEHHESSEDGSGLKAAQTDPFGWGGLLAHEFAHSWNGKYRRPKGLATPEFHTPMQGDGLWVYEGLTQYLGYVLAARSGFFTPEEWRDNWANVARGYQVQAGRSWRPVVDTARSVGLVRGVSGVWGKERRGTDYYQESALVWLEADALIREKTNGNKSLDDFIRLFYGGITDAPVVSRYETKDVIKALNAVLPYDWTTFLATRIDQVSLDTPKRSLNAAGFDLELTNVPNKAGRSARPSYYAQFGFGVGTDGVVNDLAVDGAAAAAGFGPGLKITKIDGQPFSLDLLYQVASTASQASFQVEGVGRSEAITLRFSPRPNIPHLAPVPGKKNHLDMIGRAI